MNVEDKSIKCQAQGCPGTYERRKVLHCFEIKDGPLCIDHVPALVCDVCGDRQFEGDTVERLQHIIRERREPDRHVPAYEFSAASATT